jgi:RNA polymerase sigma-70 factor (ECF subfamily)
VKAQSATVPIGETDRFATTHWSVVLHAHPANGGEKGNDALTELCRTYWRPIFAFICRRGYPANDAQDLTQDFFVMVLEGNLLKLADPSRGRFRSLLLRSLQNFLADAAEKRRAAKRGGRFDFVSWEDWMAKAPSQLCVPLRAVENLPPEKIFDIRWAATIVERALRRLREECEARGRRRLFDLIGGYLIAERADVSYSAIAQRMNVAETQVKRLLCRMRQRYRDLLRDEVAQTVESPEDVDEEIRYLCAALSAAE